MRLAFIIVTAFVLSGCTSFFLHETPGGRYDLSSSYLDYENEQTVCIYRNDSYHKKVKRIDYPKDCPRSTY